MAIQTDSCGRYVPRAGDVIFWRFKKAKNAPFKRHQVLTVDKDANIISLVNAVGAAGEPIHLDPAELQVRG